MFSPAWIKWVWSSDLPYTCEMEIEMDHFPSCKKRDKWVSKYYSSSKQKSQQYNMINSSYRVFSSMVMKIDFVKLRWMYSNLYLDIFTWKVSWTINLKLKIMFESKHSKSQLQVIKRVLFQFFLFLKNNHF